MLKKMILPAVAATVILAGCSSGDLSKLQSEVDALKAEVSELKGKLGIADRNAGTEADSEDATGSSKTAEKGLYSLGESLTVEGVTFTITAGERKPQLTERITADDGYEFAIYHVDIHNTGTEDYHYSQSDYSIVTGSGEIEDNYLILGALDDHLGNGDLASNGKRSGWVAFKVPVGDQPQELRYEKKTFSQQTVFKVKLN